MSAAAAVAPAAAAASLATARRALAVARRERVASHRDTLLNLLAWERETEVAGSRERFAKPQRRLEEEGLALFNLFMRKEKRFMGGDVLHFSLSPEGGSRPGARPGAASAAASTAASFSSAPSSSSSSFVPLPFHRLATGDAVILSGGDALSSDAGEGVVLGRGPGHISVVVRKMPKTLPREGMWRVDVGVSEVTFKRMEGAVKLVCARDDAAAEGGSGGAAAAAAGMGKGKRAAAAAAERLPTWLMPLLLENSLIKTGVIKEVPAPPHTTKVSSAAADAAATLDLDKSGRPRDAVAAILADNWNAAEAEGDLETALDGAGPPLLVEQLQTARPLSVIERKLQSLLSFRRPMLPKGGVPALPHLVTPAAKVSEEGVTDGEVAAAAAAAVADSTGAGASSVDNSSCSGSAAPSVDAGDAAAAAAAAAKVASEKLMNEYVQQLSFQRITALAAAARRSGGVGGGGGGVLTEGGGGKLMGSQGDASAALEDEAEADLAAGLAIARLQQAWWAAHDGATATAAPDASNNLPVPVTFDRVMPLLDGVLGGLNPSQRSGVVIALFSRMSLIQGPPGTGKTATVSALVRAWVDIQSAAVRASDTVKQEVNEARASAHDSGLLGLRGSSTPVSAAAATKSASGGGAPTKKESTKRGGASSAAPAAAAAAPHVSPIIQTREMVDSTTELLLEGGNDVPDALLAAEGIGGDKPPPGGQILAVASSNTAVDQLMEGLHRFGLKVIRIGDPVRVRPELRALSLESAIASHPDMERVAALHEEVVTLVGRVEKTMAGIAERGRRAEAARAVPTIGLALGNSSAGAPSALGGAALRPSVTPPPPPSSVATGGTKTPFSMKPPAGGAAAPASSSRARFSTLLHGGAWSPSAALYAPLASFGGLSMGGISNSASSSKALVLYSGAPARSVVSMPLGGVGGAVAPGGAGGSSSAAFNRAEAQLMAETASVLAKRVRAMLASRASLGPSALLTLRRTLAALAKKVELLKRGVSAKIVRSAQVIAATCSGSGHEMLDGMRFSLVVCDEASQIHEAELLLPLSKTAAHAQVVLIGDEHQLPPTIASDQAFPLRVSLFERLAAAAHPRSQVMTNSHSLSGLLKDAHDRAGRDSTTTSSSSSSDAFLPDVKSAPLLPAIPLPRIMLSQQYRMHPAIAAFPTWAFYASRIRNAPQIFSTTRKVPPPGFPWPAAQPVAFVPIRAARPVKGSTSDVIAPAATTSTDVDAVTSAPVDAAAAAEVVSVSADASALSADAVIEAPPPPPRAKPEFVGNERSEQRSKCNDAEVAAVVRIVKGLLARPGSKAEGEGEDAEAVAATAAAAAAAENVKGLFGAGKHVSVGDIGIVTPYLAQVKALTDALKAEGFPVAEGRNDPVRDHEIALEAAEAAAVAASAAAAAAPQNAALAAAAAAAKAAAVTAAVPLDPSVSELLEVRTVDGYQGREKPIIIFSAVRSNNTNTVGFLADYRRANVALTRAERGVIVVGDPDTLSRNDVWGAFLKFVSSNALEVSPQWLVGGEGGERRSATRVSSE